MPRNLDQVIEEIVGGDESFRQSIYAAEVCAEIARNLYQARVRAGLTQAQLAKKVGTTQSAIARIEDSQYDGHSIRTIAKVAMALDLDVSLSLKERVEFEETTGVSSVAGFMASTFIPAGYSYEHEENTGLGAESTGRAHHGVIDAADHQGSLGWIA